MNESWTFSCGVSTYSFRIFLLQNSFVISVTAQNVLCVFVLVNVGTHSAFVLKEISWKKSWEWWISTFFSSMMLPLDECLGETYIGHLWISPSLWINSLVALEYSLFFPLLSFMMLVTSAIFKWYLILSLVNTSWMFCKRQKLGSRSILAWPFVVFIDTHIAQTGLLWCLGQCDDKWEEIGIWSVVVTVFKSVTLYFLSDEAC